MSDLKEQMLKDFDAIEAQRSRQSFESYVKDCEAKFHTFADWEKAVDATIAKIKTDDAETVLQSFERWAANMEYLDQNPPSLADESTGSIAVAVSMTERILKAMNERLNELGVKDSEELRAVLSRWNRAAKALDVWTFAAFTALEKFENLTHRG
jgi:hypothetical protein